MATDVFIYIGAGRDYNTLIDARTYLNGLDLITLNQRIRVRITENQTINNTASSFSNTLTNNECYILVEPDVGLSWLDLNPSGAFYPPATGIRINANSTSGGALNIYRGYVFDRFIIPVTVGTGGVSPVRIGETSSARIAAVTNCWISGDQTLGPLVYLRAPGSASAEDVVTLRNSVVIGTSASNTAAVVGGSGGNVYNNTIIANAGSGLALRPEIPSANRGMWVIDSAIVGNWETVHTGGASVSAGALANTRNNYLTGSYTQTGTGSTYTSVSWATGATAASLFENIASNLRPSATSALLAGGGTRAQNTVDINGNNRGVQPDIGAIQRSSAPALATGTIGSVVVSGQTVTISGTQTNAVSGTVTLQGYTPVAIDIAGGNWTLPNYTAVPAGTYSLSLTLLNSQGAPTVISGPNVVISSYEGSPEGTNAEEPTGVPVISGLTGIPTGNTTANVDLITTRSGGTIWSVITANSTTPTKVQIKAGQTNTGTAAPWAGSQGVSTFGQRTLAATGLTATATYYAHAYHEHPDGDSNLLTSAIWQQPPTVFPPVITNQPDDITVAGGATATFVVEYTGTATVSVQWRKNGVNIPGANSASYTTPAVTIEDNGAQFTVYLSNAQGNVTSSPAVLTVLAPVILPEITDQPDDVTVTVGEQAVFTAQANPGGGTLAYQWFVRAGGDTGTGTATGGATSNTYTTGVLGLVHNGRQYRLRVTNSAGEVFTNWATVTVVPEAQPISGTITSQTVPSDGQVVIQGAYTGTPTEIFITLNSLSGDVGPVPATFSNGTFGVTIQNVPYGTYQVEILMNSDDATFNDVNDVPLVVSPVSVPTDTVLTLNDLMLAYFRSQVSP